MNKVIIYILLILLVTGCNKKEEVEIKSTTIEDVVKEEDPMSFMIVTSATEIYGEGYKNLFSEKNNTYIMIIPDLQRPSLPHPGSRSRTYRPAADSWFRSIRSRS